MKTPLFAREGTVRRWNWRTNARFPGHWNMTTAQIRKELRMMSWRRP